MQRISSRVISSFIIVLLDLIEALVTRVNFKKNVFRHLKKKYMFLVCDKVVVRLSIIIKYNNNSNSNNNNNNNNNNNR